ncbi:putative Translation initiation factor eIF-2B subunit beta [Blattamonas nauphoetae]|uniref:Translation initiation factor eIF2B subunit beta n=1 Tax=Blattamonas nauphoetae TaxID=2049346 RepID=A0ABQ9YM42_9EUKA|nr:putative Translation initiation factor eIF-2B subunit beta [Blattamonas nauphoetae]
MSGEETTEKQSSAIIAFLQTIQEGSGSLHIAQSTLSLCQTIISTTKGLGKEGVLASLGSVKELIRDNRPTDFVINNMILYSMKVVREHGSKTKKGMGVKKCLDMIQGFSQQISDYYTNIISQAPQYINNSSVVMTHGYSRMVFQFLTGLPKTHTFTVIVAAAAPTFQGHRMAADLSKAGIHTILVSDAAVPAMISKVTSIVVGVSAVTADGGIIGDPGISTLALAAKERSLPFLALSGLYKFTPFYTSQQNFNELLDPSTVISPHTLVQCGDPLIINPKFDYVRPSHISLIVSNVENDAVAPINVYQHIKQLYSEEDYTNHSHIQQNITAYLYPAASPSPSQLSQAQPVLPKNLPPHSFEILNSLQPGGMLLPAITSTTASHPPFDEADSPSKEPS